MHQSVTFRQVILGSECHVLIQYFWMRVSRSDRVILKEKYVKLMEDIQSQRTQLPKWFGLEAWVLMCDLDIIDLLRAYFNVVDTCSCCLLLSPVKCYSWVHTIIYCILIPILGWPMISTQYMLPPYWVLLVFFFVFLLWNAASVPMTSDLPQL